MIWLLSIGIIALIFNISAISINRKVHTIRKGTHGTWWDFAPTFFRRSMSRTVMFSDSCIYEPDSENDWNKLFGWSYGHHHDNSIRVGWRVYKGKSIELALYVYRDGVREVHIIDAIPLNIMCEIYIKTFKDKLEIKSKKYIKDIEIDRYFSINTINYKWYGYLLFPYFGGQAKAPHTMKIKILHND